MKSFEFEKLISETRSTLIDDIKGYGEAGFTVYNNEGDRWYYVLSISDEHIVVVFWEDYKNISDTDNIPSHMIYEFYFEELSLNELYDIVKQKSEQDTE